MRLNALYPSDNPMEELLFCFGGDDSGGGGGAGGSAGDFEGTNFGGDTATAGGDLGDSGFDAFDASGDYVSSAISDFAAGPSTTASGGYSNYGGGDNDRDDDGIPDTIDIDAGTGTGVPMGGGGGDTSPVTAPSINIGDAINDFLGRPSRSSRYAGQAAAQQAAAQQAALQARPVGTGTVLSPVSTTAVATPTAAITPPVGTGTVLRSVPVERRTPEVVDVAGYTPTNYTQADLDKYTKDYNEAREEAYAEKQFGFDLGPFAGPFGMYERIADALLDPTAALANQMAERGYATYNGEAVPSSVANYNEQGLSIADVGGPLSEGGRVAAYDPQINAVYDTSPFANINPFGDKMPQEIADIYAMKAEADAARAAQLGGGDGGSTSPLLVPEQTPEEERAQSAFPAFTPRRFEYQPFTSKFYTIPSRFTRPTSLLG